MDCNDCKNYVSAFLDGELDHNLKIVFEQHLETCTECQLLLKAENRVKQLLKDSYHPEKAPFSLRANIRQEISKKQERTGFFNVFLARPATSLVSAFAVMVLIFLSFQMFQTDDKTIDLSKVEIAGQIECISCYLAEHEHLDNCCDQYGHELGFVTSSNEVFSFFPNEVSYELHNKMEYIHSEAKLTGWIFHQANIIELEKYQIIGQAVASNSSDGNLEF
jgi:mycothiol system anti-sigma-R factor